MIPGLGRSPGEGIGYPLQYSWASLVAQMVTNPPAMQKTWVRCSGWEDPLEKGTATHSNILAYGEYRIPTDRVRKVSEVIEQLSISQHNPTTSVLLKRRKFGHRRVRETMQRHRDPEIHRDKATQRQRLE